MGSSNLNLKKDLFMVINHPIKLYWGLFEVKSESYAYDNNNKNHIRDVDMTFWVLQLISIG